MVVTLTGCSIITITDFTLYFFDQDYKVVRMSFFDRCSQILHNFFLFAENELINNFPSFCFLQVDEKTICPHQCKWNTYYYQGRHLPSNIGGAWDIFKEKGERRKEEWGKREKKNWGKEEKGKRVKRETCLVGLEPPEPLPKWRPRKVFHFHTSKTEMKIWSSNTSVWDYTTLVP